MQLEKLSPIQAFLSVFPPISEMQKSCSYYHGWCSHEIYAAAHPFLLTWKCKKTWLDSWVLCSSRIILNLTFWNHYGLFQMLNEYSFSLQFHIAKLPRKAILHLGDEN